MSRGGSFGGGQSSLGYLFGSSDRQQATDPPPSPPALKPPYGVDAIEENPPKPTPPALPPTKEDQSPFNNYQRTDGQNSGNFLTDRPSTKVNSVPGGDSSLGYLFGEK